jgi:RNA polymerase sigma-70 factor (ECF subfamily)
VAGLPGPAAPDPAVPPPAYPVPAAPGPGAAAARVAPEAEPSDRDLLRRHCTGDATAFGILFTRHRERLWAVALRTLGDPEEAADALQDAMISAFRRAGDFRGDSAVTTWLHRIVVNACLDRIRRRAARPAASGVDEPTLDALAAGSALADPSVDSDTTLDVLDALRTLGPEQRAVLVLVDMLGYPVADTAEILGISPGTVKSRCARGRARLLPLLAHLRGATAASPASGAASTSRGGPSPVAAGTEAAGGRNRPALPRVSPAEEAGDSHP